MLLYIQIKIKKMKKNIIKILNNFWDIMKIVLFCVLFVALVVLIEKYPLIKSNAIFSVWLFAYWALTGGFSYEVYNSGNITIEYPMRPIWIVLFIITTIVCIPAGLFLRFIFYSRSLKKDKITFTKKFHFFFNKTPNYF